MFPSQGDDGYGNHTMPRQVAAYRIEGEHGNGAVSGDMAQARARETCHSLEHRDLLYLFACHIEWRDKGNIRAYQELVAALDDCNQEIRAVAETLLHRSSPRPKSKNTDYER